MLGATNIANQVPITGGGGGNVPSFSLAISPDAPLDSRITFLRDGDNKTFTDSTGVLRKANKNWIRNSEGSGAVAGAFGTLPTDWQGLTSISGVTRAVVGTGIESGIPYVDLKISGTATAAIGSAIVAGFQTYTDTPALTGEEWTSSIYVRLMEGGFTGLTLLTNQITERSAASAVVSSGNLSLLSSVTDAALSTQRYSYPRTLSGGATVAYITNEIRFNCNIGAVIDFTLRVGLPQLEKGLVATEPSITRGVASAALVYEHDVTNVEAQNLILRSNDFNSAGWSTKTTISFTPGVADPQGNLTATTITATGAGGVLQQVATVSSGEIISGAYWLRRRTGTGNISMRVGELSLLVLAVTEEWQLFERFNTPLSTNGRLALHIATAGDEVDIWRAQLNTGATALPYVETTDSPYTRYFCKGASIEADPRSNVLRNNNMTGASVGVLPTNWISSSPAGVTTSCVGVGSENGVPYVDVRFVGTNTSGSTGICSVLFDSLAGKAAATLAQAWTPSIYLKLAAGSFVNTSAVVMAFYEIDAADAFLRTASGANPTITGTLTRRASPTTTAAPTVAFVRSPQIYFTVGNGLAIDVTIRIGAPQLEQAADMSSIILQSGTVLTKPVDSFEVNNITDYINVNQGTVFCDYIMTGGFTGANSAGIWWLNSGVALRGIGIDKKANLNGASRETGVVLNALPAMTVNADGIRNKVAVCYTNNLINAVANGGALSEDVTPMTVVPVANKLTIANGATTGTGPYTSNLFLKEWSYYNVLMNTKQKQNLTA